MASPVKYVRNMELHGSLFEDKCLSGAVSSVFTNLYFDHTNLFITFPRDQSPRPWPLGDLLEGHEFLIIMPASGTSNLSDDDSI